MPSGKKKDDMHQPIFPTKYYQNDKFVEFCQIFEKCEELKYVTVLALFSGLRIFEIAKLKKQDFIFVPNNKEHGSPKHYLIKIIGKGKKFREVLLINENPIELFKKLLEDKSKDSYLFYAKAWKRASLQKKLLSQEQIDCYAQMIGNEMSKNISNLTLEKFNVRYPAHSMRRSFATCLYSIDTPIDTIANLMGHSNTKTTKQYIDNMMISARTLKDMSRYVMGKNIEKQKKTEDQRKKRTKTTIIQTVEEVNYS